MQLRRRIDSALRLRETAARLRQHGRCLSTSVLHVQRRAMVGEELYDPIESIEGGRVKRGIAGAVHGVHIGSLEQELHGREHAILIVLAQSRTRRDAAFVSIGATIDLGDPGLWVGINVKVTG